MKINKIRSIGMRNIKFKCYVRFLQEIQTVKELRADGSVVTDGYEYAIEADAIDLIQFTGLKDKDGGDIYESYIVESDFYLPEIPSVAAVKYNNGAMRFVFDSGEQDAFEYGRLKVIGNIYQNPELLKAT